MSEMVREKIAVTIHFGDFPELPIGKGDRADALKFWGDIASCILNLKAGRYTLKELIENADRIEIRADNQTVTKFLVDPTLTHVENVRRAREDMLKGDKTGRWVKCQREVKSER